MRLGLVLVERGPVAVALVEDPRQRRTLDGVHRVDEGAGLPGFDPGQQLLDHRVEQLGGGGVIELETDDQSEHGSTIPRRPPATDHLGPPLTTATVAAATATAPHRPARRGRRATPGARSAGFGQVVGGPQARHEADRMTAPDQVAMPRRIGTLEPVVRLEAGRPTGGVRPAAGDGRRWGEGPRRVGQVDDPIRGLLREPCPGRSSSTSWVVDRSALLLVASGTACWRRYGPTGSSCRRSAG